MVAAAAVEVEAGAVAAEGEGEAAVAVAGVAPPPRVGAARGAAGAAAAMQRRRTAQRGRMRVAMVAARQQARIQVQLQPLGVLHPAPGSRLRRSRRLRGKMPLQLLLWVNLRRQSAGGRAPKLPSRQPRQRLQVRLTQPEATGMTEVRRRAGREGAFQSG